MTTPMRPATPPQAAERLLEALGAEPEFRDALLGDLAEEFALRSAYDGERAAKRWYWREALRVAPHLLRHWARRLRAGDIARLVGLVGAAYFLIGVTVLGILTVVEVAVERAIGPTIFPWHDAHPDGLTMAILLMGDFTVAAAGGWLASRLENRAPVVAALTLGLVWATIALVAPLPGRATLPMWYVLGQAVAVLAGTMVGAVRRIATASAR